MSLRHLNERRKKKKSIEKALEKATELIELNRDKLQANDKDTVLDPFEVEQLIEEAKFNLKTL